jgi:hypothetical protein
MSPRATEEIFWKIALTGEILEIVTPKGKPYPIHN